jgi:hypothetical protein
MIAKYQIATHAGETFRRLSWHDLREARRAHPDTPRRLFQFQLALYKDPIFATAVTSASEFARVQQRLDVLEAADVEDPLAYDARAILGRALVSREHKSSLDAARLANLVAAIVAFAVGPKWPVIPVDLASADGGLLVVDIPGEVGQHATLRSVPGAILATSDPQDEALVVRGMAAHPVLAHHVAQLARGPRGALVRAALERRPQAYAFGVVLRAAVVRWSYDARLPNGVDDLDLSTAAALVRAALEFSLPPGERPPAVH